MTFFRKQKLNCNHLPLYPIYSFKTHLLNSAVFVTAVTSSLERLKASLRTVFPSELVLDPIPDSLVDQHLTDMLSDHNNHLKATHISGYSYPSTPLPPSSSSSSSSTNVDNTAGLKDAVKVLILCIHTGIYLRINNSFITCHYPSHYYQKHCTNFLNFLSDRQRQAWQ